MVKKKKILFKPKKHRKKKAVKKEILLKHKKIRRIKPKLFKIKKHVKKNVSKQEGKMKKWKKKTIKRVFKMRKHKHKIVHKKKAPIKVIYVYKKTPSILAKVKATMFKEKYKPPEFKISAEKHLITLPEGKEIDFRYPLLAPFAYVHLSYNREQKQLFYNLIEPKMDENEKKIYEQLIKGLLEVIDVELSAIKKTEQAIDYVEQQVQKVLSEYKLRPSKETYLKIMYYIFRNFVGLNEIEPLMHDPYIEDISCDGTGIPLYIVHRKYGSLPTNIIYEDEKQLREFVVKLAERCGRFISYAEPLLDGSLPDGSRVQSSYAGDVTTRGPSFSIRKFLKEPFSPIDLLENGTVSSEVLAYLWLAVESGASMLIGGGAATGKCVAPEEFIQLANGEIKTAKELYDSICKGVLTNGGVPQIDLITLTPNLKVLPVRVNKFWMLESPPQMITTKTMRGFSCVTTPEHPYIVLRSGFIKKIRADQLKVGDYIACSRTLPIKGCLQKINLFNYDIDIFIANSQKLVKTITKKLINKYGNYKNVARNFDFKYNTFKEWLRNNNIPLKNFKRMLLDLNEDFDNVNKKIKFLSGGNYKRVFNVKIITPELAKIIAYAIADGRIEDTYVLYYSSREELRKEFDRCILNTFDVSCTHRKYGNRDYRVVSSKPVAEILNKVFEIPANKRKAKIVFVPDILMRSRNKEISAFLSALFDCESSVNKKECEIEFSTASKKLVIQIAYLFQRFGITTQIDKKKVKKTIYYRLRISNKNNLEKFKKHIGFTHSTKNKKLKYILSKTKKYNTNVDIIPNIGHLIRAILVSEKISISQMAKKIGIGREVLRDVINGKRNSSKMMLQKISKYLPQSKYSNLIRLLASSDVFWDRVKEIRKVDSKSKFVYDLTVDGTHNFLAGSCGIFISNTTFLNAISMFIPPTAKIISIEDTRELNLPHENWVPAVTRTGFAKGYGEVTLFDLLKESFRQSPDYVIVGEVRGAEAYVMFQGMAAGIPCQGTMHAGKVEDIIYRLQTPPISLSPALLETLDLVVILVHAREKGESARRVKEVVEIESVDTQTGMARTNKAYNWLPSEDTFEYRGYSWLLQEIAKLRGVTIEQLQKEIENRKKFLEWLKKEKITKFKDVAKMVSEYYKNPQKMLR